MLNPADVLGAIGGDNNTTAGEQFQLNTIRNVHSDNWTGQDTNPLCSIAQRSDNSGEIGIASGLNQQTQQVHVNEAKLRYSSPLERYLDTQYIFCQCPYSFGFQLPRGLRILQTITFVLLIFLACVGSLANMRDQALITTDEKDKIHQYSELGYFAVDLFTRLYFLTMLVISRRKIFCILDCLTQLGKRLSAMELSEGNKAHTFTPWSRWIILGGFLPLLASLLWGLFGHWQFNQWKIQYNLYSHATSLGGLFVVWRRGDASRELEKMQDNFLDKSDARWITIGVIGIICTIAKSLESYAIRHFMLALTLSIKRHCDAWKRVIKQLGRYQNAESAEENDRQRLEQIWTYYFEIRRCSQNINKQFGILMKFIHVSNMLVLAFFIARIVTSEHTTISFCLFLYEVALILLFSFTASRIALVNDVARTWIKSNTTPTSGIIVDGTTLIVLLDDIRQHPIGIGSGSFFIGEDFIQRFFGLLASFLVYMTDDEPNRVS